MRCEEAIEVWSKLKAPDEQFLQLMEECSELAVECSHALRGRGSEEALTEEVADVVVMLNWLYEHKGEKFQQSVFRVVNEKMNRNLSRIGLNARIDGYKTYGEKE